MKAPSATETVQANVRRMLSENAALGRAPATLTELAEAMKTTLPNVSKMMKKTSINLTSVERMAEALKISFWELVKPAGAPGGHSLQDCHRAIGEVVEDLPRLRELAAKWADHLAAQKKKA